MVTLNFWEAGKCRLTFFQEEEKHIFVSFQKSLPHWEFQVLELIYFYNLMIILYKNSS